MNRIYKFEWDFEKELICLQKHQYSFTEATEIFQDPQVIHLEDEAHSSEEDRYYAIGNSKKGRILTVRYTWRGENIRIFGVGKWRKWRKFYEKNTQSRKNEKD